MKVCFLGRNVGLNDPTPFNFSHTLYYITSFQVTDQWKCWIQVMWHHKNGFHKNLKNHYYHILLVLLEYIYGENHNLLSSTLFSYVITFCFYFQKYLKTIETAQTTRIFILLNLVSFPPCMAPFQKIRKNKNIFALEGMNPEFKSETYKHRHMCFICLCLN